jgi:hypothetical protein
MNFGKLLAAGSSSISNCCAAVVYHHNKRVYVPKFEPVKNPFARTVPAPEAPAPVISMTKPQPVPLPRHSPAPAAWTARLNPLSRLRGSMPPAAQMVRTEQIELSLETVKVVHNDLSDADLEVVPAKSRPAPADGGSRSPGGSLADLGAKLGAKLFRVNPV